MSIKKDYPILEFDYNRDAVIEPSMLIKARDIPEKCVITFFKDVIDDLKETGKLRTIIELKSESGILQFYEMEYKGEKVVVFHSLLGAPAAAAMLEEAIALGCSKFIACGGAGVIKKGIAVGHLIIPNAAVRDEGTSYHYLEPSREVEVNKNAVKAIKNVLDYHGVKYLEAKTWTTDAFYRETREKVELRASEGCVTVEMECAAFCAVAQFRNVTFGQILYSGDDLSCEEWDHRSWADQTDVRESVFELAVESCLKL